VLSLFTSVAFQITSDVHIALALEAGALGVVLGRVCHARRRGARNLARSYTPCQPLRFLFLQLLQHLLHGDGVEDVLGGGREDGEDGKGAVFLVLLEAAAEAAQLAFVVMVCRYMRRTSPLRCGHRSCAGGPRTASPAHTAPRGILHPRRLLRWRSWSDCDAPSGGLLRSCCARPNTTGSFTAEDRSRGEARRERRG
jgi:hypothetical protein